MDDPCEESSLAQIVIFDWCWDWRDIGYRTLRRHVNWMSEPFRAFLTLSISKKSFAQRPIINDIATLCGSSTRRILVCLLDPGLGCRCLVVDTSRVLGHYQRLCRSTVHFLVNVGFLETLQEQAIAGTFTSFFWHIILDECDSVCIYNQCHVVILTRVLPFPRCYARKWREIYEYQDGLVKQHNLLAASGIHVSAKPCPYNIKFVRSFH